MRIVIVFGEAEQKLTAFNPGPLHDKTVPLLIAR